MTAYTLTLCFAVTASSDRQMSRPQTACVTASMRKFEFKICLHTKMNSKKIEYAVVYIDGSRAVIV